MAFIAGNTTNKERLIHKEINVMRLRFSNQLWTAITLRLFVTNHENEGQFAPELRWA